MAEFRILWVRDGAGKMAQPSIDREDPAGSYTFRNCRFMEFEDNRRRARDLREQRRQERRELMKKHGWED